MADLIYDEVQLFAICFLLGMCLAFIYDVIRVVRRLFKHWDWMVDLEDLLYWIFTGWSVFKTLFVFNRGALRGYAFFGLFIGVLLYSLTVSRLFLFFVEKMLPCWNKGKVILLKPFVFMVNFVRKTLKNIAYQVKMAIRGR